MRTLVLVALLVVAAASLTACKDAPGADGRYANTYRGRTGEGGTGLPVTPYDPNSR